MPQVQNYLSDMYFKINGVSPSESLKGMVREIVVDTSLYLPDMFSIQFSDPDLSLIDSTDLEIGKLIEISGKASGESSTTTLMKGEIVAVEPELVNDIGIGMTIIIRGYDKSHRLHRGRKSETYINKTDSDIVKAIASRNGLESDVESTSVVYDHVFQDNKTDMEFIHDRARRVGYLAYVENGKLFFRKSASQSAVAVLEWGKNLSDFQARLTSADQVNKTEVYGWDVKQKKAIKGEKTSPAGTPTVNGQNHGGTMAKKALSLNADVIEVAGNRSTDTQSEADMLAQSVLNDKCQTFFQAEGLCFGNTSVRAGKQVEIKGVGKRFSGTYLITRAVHRYNKSGYNTQFEISGYHANTMRHLLSDTGKSDSYGVVIGIVTDVKDPDGLARVKVKYPTITDQKDSDWARLVTPMAGTDRGIKFIPEIDDEVLVAFEYNDINKPYIIGSLWNGKDKPPDSKGSSGDIVDSGGNVHKRVFKSRSGHIITFDDTEKAEQIIIKSSAGHVITLDDTDNSEKVSIVDKCGQKVTMDCKPGGEKIEIIDKTGKSKMVMDATKQSVAIESAMDLTIKANGKIQIDGQMGIAINTAGGNLDLKSNMQTNISGTTTSVQGQGTAEVKSSGILTIQGSLVKIN